MNAIRQFFYNRVSDYNETNHYYGHMLKDKLINKEYYVINTQTQYAKEDILNVLRTYGISRKSLIKYEKYLK